MSVPKSPIPGAETAWSDPDDTPKEGPALGLRSKERLCVVTVIDGLMTAGAETVATRIALGLDPNRFESIICSTRPSAPDHVAAAQAAGLEVLELNRRSRLDLWRWRPLVRMLRSGRVDVVHTHKFGSNIWGALLTPRTRLPVLLAHEHSWSYEGTLQRLVDRELIARRAERIVAVSPTDRMRMIELERIPANKIVFIPNGIPDRPPVQRRAARKRLGLAPSDAVVGTVCSLRPEKELETAVAGPRHARPAAAEPAVRRRRRRIRTQPPRAARRRTRRAGPSSSGSGRTTRCRTLLPRWTCSFFRRVSRGCHSRSRMDGRG